jgi:hypothetical protein
MNVNFGLFPDVATHARGRDRKKAVAQRALRDIAGWLNDCDEIFHAGRMRDSETTAEQERLTT